MICHVCGNSIDASKIHYTSQYREEFIICTDCYPYMSKIEIALFEKKFAEELEKASCIFTEC